MRDVWTGPPFDDLYHCMGNTYGTWLPGSDKGFRTRHHRQDVPFDYKNPPPEEAFYGLEEHARELMTRDEVLLNPEQRRRALAEFLKSFSKRDISIFALAIGKVHFHVLAPFTDRNPRKWIGIAKKESSHYMKEQGLAPVGGLWAVRCECLPVRDSAHRDNARDYILEHKLRGAAIYPDP